MGVTIHYNGKLKANVNRKEVVDVIRDMANSLEWEITDIDDDDIDILGVITQPHPSSEPLSFVFANNGLVVNPFVVGYNKDKNIEPVIDDSVKYCSCKTQFSSPATHISIIKLLEFLKKQYFEELEIYDDGGYYPNSDTEELIHRIDRINTAMDMMEEALNNADFSSSGSESEDIEVLVKKIEKIFEQIMEKLKNNMK